MSISTVSRITPMRPLAGVLVAHHRDRVERVPAFLDRAQDRARGVVAADALEPVGDLALPGAVDDHDQVEHARRRERLVGGVALAQHLAERRLDRVRIRVALRPDVFAHSRRHLLVAVEQRVRLGGSRRPGRVLGHGRRRVLVPRGQDRVDDPPQRLDLVVAGEQRRVAAHRVEDQPLVRLGRLRQERRAVAELHVDRPDPHPRAGDLGPERHRHALVGLERSG